MTVKTVTKDDRYQLCGPLNCVQAGMFWQKTQSGGNRAVGESFLAMHDYVAEFYNFKLSNHTWWPTTVPANITYTSTDPVQISGRPWDANDDNKLLSKLKEKYDQHGFNGGAFAGELGKTTDSLVGRAKQLAAIAGALKKGRPDKALQALMGAPPSASSIAKMAASQRRVGRRAYRKRFRDRNATPERQRLSDAWLEAQYGVLPLLSDIYELSRAIGAAGKPRPERITCKHCVDRTVAMSGDRGGKGRATYCKRIVAYVEPAESTWPATMGLQDPALVLWELVPYSFVVDWFLPVGTYLAAANIAARARGTFAVTTKEAHFASGSGWRADYVSPAGYTETPPTEFFSRKVSINRVVTTQLAARLPVFRNPLNYNGADVKVANAIALLGGAFSKRA